MAVDTELDAATQPRSASRTSSILALARMEAGRMLRHPAFLLGLGATVFAVVTRPSEDWAGDGRFLATTSGVLVAMGIATLLTGALVAGRQRLLSDPDLFPATPATPADRVLATALGLVGPGLVVAALVAAVGVRTALADGFVRGEGEYARSITPNWAEWVQPVLLMVLAGVVGIAVAHLRRGRLAALVFAVVVFFRGNRGALDRPGPPRPGAASGDVSRVRARAGELLHARRLGCERPTLASAR